MSRRSKTAGSDQDSPTSDDTKVKSQEKQAMLLAQDTGHFSLVRYGVLVNYGRSKG